LYFALLISVLAKVGVIILGFVTTEEATVAVYSAAAETGKKLLIGWPSRLTVSRNLKNTRRKRSPLPASGKL